MNATRDTIAALATPPGRGGIGVIRVSGPLAPSIAREILGEVPRPRRAVIRPFRDADGIHFTAADLMTLRARPKAFLAAASCHTRAELDRAMTLDFDFVVLGPVREKSTADKSPPLGWERFPEIARGATLPVYAIGGLTRNDVRDAWRAGAHGVAMIRGAWS